MIPRKYIHPARLQEGESDNTDRSRGERASESVTAVDGGAARRAGASGGRCGGAGDTAGSSAGGSGTGGSGSDRDRDDGSARSHSGSGSGSLGLAVGDLADGSRSRADGTWARSGKTGGSLGLPVRDLADGSRGGSTSRDLRLPVGELADGSRSWADGSRARSGKNSWSLGLSVRDLADRGAWSASGSLGLSITDLGDGSTGSSSDLGLSVGNLSSDTDAGSGRLAITLLADGGTAGGATGQDIDENGLALSGPAAIVQVVEATAQALVPDGGATEGEGAIVAHGEARGVDGIALRGLVELELVVGGNVTSAALGILQVAVAQGEDEGSFVTAGALGRRSQLLLLTEVRISMQRTLERSRFATVLLTAVIWKVPECEAAQPSGAGVLGAPEAGCGAA